MDILPGNITYGQFPDLTLKLRYLIDFIFLGHNCPEALGDYFAGPNHTLPTGGTARFSSPLSVDDFVKKSQYLYYTPEALSVAQETVSNFAKKEGLTGHARSIDIRFDPKVVGKS